MPIIYLFSSVLNSQNFMRKIIYYVACSIDGYIEGVNGDISGFIPDGNGVEKYLQDLQEFDTVIMGRKTYEFGYQFGLQPGQPAYPHMEHYIFSSSLHFDNPSEKVHVTALDLDVIHRLKQQNGSDIYLCGGGKFAAWLLQNELIDILKIKLNPLILGEGVRIFGDTTSSHKLELLNSETYEKGLQIMTYKIHYHQ